MRRPGEPVLPGVRVSGGGAGKTAPSKLRVPSAVRGCPGTLHRAVAVQRCAVEPLRPDGRNGTTELPATGIEINGSNKRIDDTGGNDVIAGIKYNRDN